ncbi:unnamed protein product [Schistocephalus solidus]|uniref:Histone-lysine N-methyltransferase n=1 Tax=Schistocephalus solidus TaxID=70667 RepID=A0A3P7CAS4_SCHSO|nr:unnamed protein product [Schistocephalus solidus]
MNIADRQNINSNAILPLLSTPPRSLWKLNSGTTKNNYNLSFFGTPPGSHPITVLGLTFQFTMTHISSHHLSGMTVVVAIADPSILFSLCSTPELPPIGHFSACAGVPQPLYEHVLENDYSQLEEQLRRDAPAAASESDSLPRQLSRESHRLWVCCINRALYIECGPRCPAYAWCSNRQFQLRLYAPTEPYYCGPEKGWGLRALKPIPKGAFIVEYAGEVIDFAEFRRRIRLYEKAKHAHHYFMSLGPEHFIDAGTKGNWARFVNHSCEPNAETQKWTVNGRLRIGFFAKYDIPAGEEITIDYQFVQYGVIQQKCYCGTPSCSGIMGVTSKQLQDKVRLKDTRAVRPETLIAIKILSASSISDRLIRQTKTREPGMAVSRSLAVISQYYPTPASAPARSSNTRPVNQNSKTLTIEPLVLCLAGFDREYGHLLMDAHRSLMELTRPVLP